MLFVKRRLIPVALGMSIVGLTVACFILAPNLYPFTVHSTEDPVVTATREATHTEAVTATRASLLTALAGIGAFATILINFRNTRILNGNLAVANETLVVTSRANRHDRYRAAIEHIGNENIDVRLGGIYELEQYAVESERGDRQRDLSVVVEVLSAFLRVHAVPTYRESAPKGLIPTDTGEKREVARHLVAVLRRTPEDLQAALNVLGRLPKDTPTHRINLRNTFLSQSILDGNFTKSFMYATNLTHANIVADLGEAILMEADLRWANLTGARLLQTVVGGAI